MSRLSVVVSLSAACAACAAFASLAVEMAEPKDVPPLFPPGAWVPNAKNWHAGRRAEIKKILADEVYGHRPVERPPHLAFSEVSPEKTMMDGNAMRRLVKIEYGGKYGTNSFSVTAFVPKSQKRVPAFVFVCNRPAEECLDPERIVKSDFWPAERIVERGYAAIAFYMGDVTPDRPHGNTLGVFAAFSDVESHYRNRREWGALSAWAWGASRVLDWIETQPDIDAGHVAVIGHFGREACRGDRPFARRKDRARGGGVGRAFRDGVLKRFGLRWRKTQPRRPSGVRALRQSLHDASLLVRRRLRGMGEPRRPFAVGPALARCHDCASPCLHRLCNGRRLGGSLRRIPDGPLRFARVEENLRQEGICLLRLSRARRAAAGGRDILPPPQRQARSHPIRLERLYGLCRPPRLARG